VIRSTWTAEVVSGLAVGETGVVGPAERQMDGVTHLLVEEDVVRVAVDTPIHPDSEFAQPAGSRRPSR